MNTINTTTLRYMLAVEETGSISKAGQRLYVSHSSISRAIKELEDEIGITVFQRSSKGVVPTPSGKDFLNQARSIVSSMEKLEERYYTNRSNLKQSVKIASQRYTMAATVMIELYKNYCKPNDSLNLILIEDTIENVMHLVSSHDCNIGIVHYTSDNEEAFFRRLGMMDFSYEVVDVSPICIQINTSHPLVEFDTVSLKMLEEYPHIVYADEDVTNINFCSDINSFANGDRLKRIVVQDRGTMRAMIMNTDGYYVGCGLGNIVHRHPPQTTFRLLEGVGFTLNTLILTRKGSQLTELEQKFIDILKGQC